ncbi:DUF3606 domain-containing protein [Mesorhizobium sp.]|uniref:DUF3606 domain-containing protein n=1 Tax=Mesorhizobium sp. TaxID=1871066 RepID=UPI000FE713C8|nr:DUF3606 domain-containing protein [Mesorhizobium sp.]RWO52372.1 MAG: DUF3606 domain-containing protein [Mesorhizobium sp.]TIM13045.1 MAG: DUF3606 domain-containing protein [Mesorhizobium sp.]TIN26481.1 MAG: DUF3606 domain-containing protein [Mesorhizobium sp.]TIN35890.1 MAG: DUF3606 domain-containing protein [Mesorhizobium sp.]TJU84641.1 MAG: DUF3606 domain-containing protein [Mesorhizobium sp.]
MEDNQNRLSVDEYYEVEHFARENGISPSQVSRLIKKIGNDREALTKAAMALRGTEVRYRTNNEATGYNGKDQAKPC